jgi:glyoxylase-like metal-dependent hydrolase (beta-lactamase superfamily II)
MAPRTVRRDSVEPEHSGPDGRLATRRWTIGSAVITSVVENQIDRIPPEFFFAEASADAVRRHGWLVPEYVSDDGTISLRVQAFVIEVDGLVVLVDPCVGNAKVRSLAFWHDQHWPFLERLADAGVVPDQVDLVVHTHLHADHVGWDTRREGKTWVPTFTGARHLYVQDDLDYCRSAATDAQDVYGDSIAPVFAAGLAEVVAPDADLGHGLVLEPSPGHTPGHVSLWLESDGQRALITGDFLHHPVQFAEPDWAEIADADADTARHTRRRMMERAAQSGALVLGTHFSGRPGGRVVPDGDGWRFRPE